MQIAQALRRAVRFGDQELETGIMVPLVPRGMACLSAALASFAWVIRKPRNPPGGCGKALLIPIAWMPFSTRIARDNKPGVDCRFGVGKNESPRCPRCSPPFL